jgi:hypothetical protein
MIHYIANPSKQVEQQDRMEMLTPERLKDL